MNQIFSKNRNFLVLFEIKGTQSVPLISNRTRKFLSTLLTSCVVIPGNPGFSLNETVVNLPNILLRVNVLACYSYIWPETQENFCLESSQSVLLLRANVTDSDLPQLANGQPIQSSSSSTSANEMRGSSSSSNVTLPTIVLVVFSLLVNKVLF